MAYRNPDVKQVLVYMPKETILQLDAVAQWKGHNRSSLINSICKDYAHEELKKIEENGKFTTLLRKLQIQKLETRGSKPKNRPRITSLPGKTEVKKEEKKEPPKLPDWRDDIGL